MKQNRMESSNDKAQIPFWKKLLQEVKAAADETAGVGSQPSTATFTDVYNIRC